MEGKTATAGECGASFSQASSSTTVKAMASGSSGTLAVRWRIPHAPWWCLVSTLLMAGAMVFNLAVIDPTKKPIGLWSNFCRSARLLASRTFA